MRISYALQSWFPVPAIIPSSRYQQRFERFCNLLSISSIRGQMTSKNKVELFYLLVALLTHSPQLSYLRTIHHALINKRMQKHFTRHQKFWAEEMTALRRNKCVSEINLEYAPILFSSFFRRLFFLACFMLSSSLLTPTHNCFAHNNSTSAKAASFAMYLVTRRQITSPKAIGLRPVFLSMLLMLHYQKVGATKLWSSPLLA